MEAVNKNNNNKKKKSGIGRQKIEIKKIEKETSRQVAFTKRRQGVMKKASELSILCGVEFAFIAFSPGGNPFSFGHPSIESVATRFLACGRLDEGMAEQTAATQLIHHEMEQQLEAARGQRAAAEERQTAAAAAIGEEMVKVLEGELEGMSLEELEAARGAIEGVKKRVEMRQEEIVFREPRHLCLSVDAKLVGVIGPAVSIGVCGEWSSG